MRIPLATLFYSFLFYSVSTVKLIANPGFQNNQPYRQFNQQQNSYIGRWNCSTGNKLWYRTGWKQQLYRYVIALNSNGAYYAQGYAIAAGIRSNFRSQGRWVSNAGHVQAKGVMITSSGGFSGRRIPWVFEGKFAGRGRLIWNYRNQKFASYTSCNRAGVMR